MISFTGLFPRARDWLNVLEYLSIKEDIPTSETLKHAKRLLVGQAEIWIILKEGDDIKLDTWKDFCSHFITRFGGIDEAYDCMLEDEESFTESNDTKESSNANFVYETLSCEESDHLDHVDVQCEGNDECTSQWCDDEAPTIEEVHDGNEETDGKDDRSGRSLTVITPESLSLVSQEHQILTMESGYQQESEIAAITGEIEQRNQIATITYDDKQRLKIPATKPYSVQTYDLSMVGNRICLIVFAGNVRIECMLEVTWGFNCVFVFDDHG